MCGGDFYFIDDDIESKEGLYFVILFSIVVVSLGLGDLRLFFLFYLLGGRNRER